MAENMFSYYEFLSDLVYIGRMIRKDDKDHEVGSTLNIEKSVGLVFRILLF